MKQRKWLFSVLAGVCAAAALVALFFEYISIDLTPLFNYIPEALRTGIDAMSEFLGLRSGRISFSGAEVISGLFKGGSAFTSGSVASALRSGIRAMVLIPYLFVLLSLGFAMVRRRWAWISSLGCALAGGLLTFFITLFYFPKIIYEHIEAGLLSGINTLADGAEELQSFADLLGMGEALESFASVREEMTELSRHTLSTMIRNSLGPGFWILMFSFLAFLIVAALALVLCKDTPVKYPSRKPGVVPEFPPRQPGPSAQATPSVLVETGSMQGALIPFSGSEELCIGRDPGRCSLVMDDPGIDDLHCVIRFDWNTWEYRVRDLSRGGIRCENMPLDRHEENILPGGMHICLGNAGNRLYLGDVGNNAPAYILPPEAFPKTDFTMRG